MIPIKCTFCKKNWAKTVNPALSSGLNFFPPPIYGVTIHHQQRNPNMNNRDHLLLLCTHSWYYEEFPDFHCVLGNLTWSQVVNSPTWWSLSLIFGFLWWSSVSTPKYQRETGYSNVLQQHHIHSSLPSSRHEMLKFRRVKHGMLWYRGI